MTIELQPIKNKSNKLKELKRIKPKVIKLKKFNIERSINFSQKTLNENCKKKFIFETNISLE